MSSKSTDKDVTLTRPNGETRTFGPMPADDAVLVEAVANATGHRATVRPTIR